ncbi:MAG: DUF4388 domain-containing protein [Actinomycetota bacterium]|nr:MAG: DUF4388 domain-containing protein [Actinomycetota bacterium]
MAREEEHPVTLQGSLDAFGLADVLGLLAGTGKTGTLHLHRRSRSGRTTHGLVRLRDGSITGATSDAGQQALARRLVGTGQIDAAALAAAVELAQAQRRGVVSTLVETGAIGADVVVATAGEQVVDAVFELLRWRAGSFDVDLDAVDVDDVGLTLGCADVLARAAEREAAWAEAAALIPGPDTVLAVVPALAENPSLSREEWAALALVDGRRRVRELVDLTGAGQFAMASVLAGLVRRGLVAVCEPGAVDHVAELEQRMALLRPLEEPATAAEPPRLPVGQPAVAARPTAAPDVAPPETPLSPAARSEVAGPQPARPDLTEPVGERPGLGVVPPESPAAHVPSREPAVDVPARQPAVDLPARQPVTATRVTARTDTPESDDRRVAGAGPIVGTSAVAPALESLIGRDPNVNRSLLLRLIAGVRGL